MRTVQLQHDMPDGSSHIDWMLQKPDDPMGTLVSIRLEKPLDSLEKGAFMLGLRLDDHRSAYLEYEGPVSDNRGHVRRVERGSILEWACNGDEWWITVKWSTDDIQAIRVAGEGSPPRTGCPCRVYLADSSEPESEPSER